jgi:hypothetical protein
MPRAAIARASHCNPMTIDGTAASSAIAGLPAELLECVWHVAEAAPPLAEFAAQTLHLPDAEGLVEAPLPPTTLPFVAGAFFRPPGSHRAFYHCPAIGAGDAETPTQRAMTPAVTAFKGMEPLVWTAANIGSLFQPCYSAHTIAEHLILKEGKFPGALTTAEALSEAVRAAEVQAAHIARHGGPAALPLPLCVLRHRTEDVTRMSNLLADGVSASARARMEGLAEGGLAVLFYHYPTPPVRALDIAELFAGRPFRERTIALIACADPARIINGWIGLFARLLALGYVAGSLADLESGVACQPQNACIDGGFVDAGSLTPIAELVDDTALYAALDLCTRALVETVRCLLTGREDPSGRADGPGRFDLCALSRYVTDRIRAALDQEAAAATGLDPRVLGFFRQSESLDALWHLLAAYYTARPTGFEEASRSHSLDWNRLLCLAGVGAVHEGPMR